MFFGWAAVKASIMDECLSEFFLSFFSLQVHVHVYISTFLELQ